MTKLAELKAAAERQQENMVGPVSMIVSTATILKLIAVVEALEELVTLKKWKEALPVDCSASSKEEYLRRKPMAWVAAYDALQEIDE